MVDSGILVLEIIPAVVGILTAAYSIMMIARMGTNFFRVITGWSVVLLMAFLVIVWAADIWEELLGGFSPNAKEMMRIVFVIGASWLGVGIISMTTIYGKYSEVEVFGAWLLRSPFNIITIYAVGGLAVFAASAASLAGPHNGGVDNWLLAFVLVYILLSVAAEAALPIISARRGRPAVSKEGRREIVIFAVSWMAMPSAEFALNLVPGVASYLNDLNPTSWILALVFIAMMRTIFTTRFMAIIVDPEVETSRQGGFRNFDIPRGVYLVYDEKPDSAFSLFSELVSLPLRPDAKVPGEEDSASATLTFLIPRGLVLTRAVPDDVRQRYMLHVTPIIWLTESPGERRVAPTSLAVATDTLVRFMDANPNSIVLLEGLEYLVTFNDFRRIMKSLDSLNETAWIAKGRLIIAVNPKAFDERDLALLERDRMVLRGIAGIEELKRESKVLAASA